MGVDTKIAWTDHTYSPWWGCTKVSPGCDHCYAEAFDRRVGGAHWGAGVERRRIGEKTRHEPFKWNARAQKEARRHRVFCGSMSDVFDNQVPPEWREELWATIRGTPWLIWQLLTKRPQNVAKVLPPDWGHGYFNVWLGTTTENQEEADRRIPHLLGVPATVRFLSAEPLLGPVDVGGPVRAALLDGKINGGDPVRPIGWVIVGGESGPGARPMARAWATDLMRQCDDAGVPVFFKQVGSKHTDWPGVTGKGDNPSEWPREFMVQRFPGTCSICKRPLDNPADPSSANCGGDCRRCMAAAGDPDCMTQGERA